MKTQYLTAALLLAFAASTSAHDPSSFSRAPAAETPKECKPFEGKDPTTLDLSDPKIKATYDKCEADKKAAKDADESGHDHKH